LLSDAGLIFVVNTFFNFHAIVRTSSTLNVEGDLTPRRLALHACTILLETDDALKIEALFIQFVKTNCRLGGNNRSRDPRGTAHVNPLVLSWNKAWVWAGCHCF